MPRLSVTGKPVRCLTFRLVLCVMLLASCGYTSAANSVSLSPTRVDPSEVINPPLASGPLNELHMARLVFAHGPHSNWGPGRPWWRIDWPSAEYFFTSGLQRYTLIDTSGDSVHVSLLEDQWDQFESVIKRVLPEFDISDLSASDALMNVLYELDQRTQIPGRRHLRGGAGGQVTVDMPYSPARWRGIHDSEGRLMVAVNFNMDMGDAWEHADDPVYPVPMTSLAYRFGINYVVYALTH